MKKNCRGLVSFPQANIGFGDQTPTRKSYNLFRIAISIQNQIHQLQEQVNNLEMIIRNKDDKIQELECLTHPESPNGDAICNWLS